MRIGQFIFLLFSFLFFSLPPPASAWTTMHQEFPHGEATIVVHAFCLDQGTREEVNGYTEPHCAFLNQRSWQARITNTLEQWNNAGSHFIFHSRAASPEEDPCDPQPGHIYFILADHSQPNPCVPTRHFNGGWGTYWPSQPDYGLRHRMGLGFLQHHCGLPCPLVGR